MHVYSLFALALLGWLATRRWRPRWRWPRRVLLGLFVATAALIWPFTNNLLAAWLEYELDPDQACRATSPAAIVVLPAGLRLQPPDAGPWSRLSPTSLVRIVEGLALAREHPGARLIFAGGEREAMLFQRGVGALGLLGAERVLIEDRASSTDLAARRVTELIAARNLRPAWLVTSALHMPRALLAFERNGLTACAYPVDYSAQPGPRPWWILPPPQALERADRLAYELLALLWYWVTGKI